MMSLAVRRQSARFRWPTARRDLAPDLRPSSSIEKRYALTPIRCAVL
jgi:hypothetical protein